MNLSPALLTSALKGSTTLPVGRHADGRGLYLNVAKGGSLSWVYMWKVGGKRTELGLGSFTGKGATVRLTLADARLAADAVRAEIGKGVDVLAARKAVKVAAAPVVVVTFQSVLDIYLAEAAKGWAGTQEQAWRGSLAKHAGSLLSMSVADIDTNAVLAVVQPLWPSKVAKDVRQRIEKVLDVAKLKGHRDGDNPARFKGHLEVVLGRKSAPVEGHEALPFDAMPAFWERLSGFEGNGAKALAFTILTAVRTDEARLARWEEIDLDAGLWTIPADRMKAGKAHVVPLSTQAIALLGERGEGYVFPGQNGVIGPSALRDKLTKPANRGGMGMEGLTVHGFRATFRTWASKRGYADKVAEMALAHTVGTKVTRAYDRDDTIEARTVLMQAWADFCHAANVVAFRRAS